MPMPFPKLTSRSRAGMDADAVSETDIEPPAARLVKEALVITHLQLGLELFHGVERHTHDNQN